MLNGHNRPGLSWRLSRLTAFAGVLAGLVWASGARAQCTNYMTFTGTGAIVPGDTDTGNHIDDGQTLISFPFSWSFYGVSYNSAYVCSNGNIQFGTPSGTFPAAYTNECLPAPPAQITGPAIMPHWDDLRTDIGSSGVFTSVSGSSPNRIFNIEWRAVYYNNTAQNANFEVRLYEGLARMDFVYGTVDQGGTSATVGIQSGTGSNTQFECNTGGLSSGFLVTLDCPTTWPPTCQLAAAPNYGPPGTVVTVTSHVLAGGGPPSTGITASLDASQIGAGTVTLYDDGTHGDVTPNDNIFTNQVTVAAATPLGNKTLTSTVQDAQGRQSNCQVVFQVCGGYAVPEGAHPESEPCGLNYPDFYDGGCNSTPNIYNTARFCETYSGTCANSTAYRDTDWWSFTLDGDDTVTINGQAEFPANWFIFSQSCPAITPIAGPVSNSANLPCNPSITLNATLTAGTYTFIVLPLNFNGDTVCGTNDSYWFQMTRGNNSNCAPMNTPPWGTTMAVHDTVSNCGDQNTLLTITVTPGTNPPSTGVSIVADLSAIGLSSSQAFYDDGTHGDVTANDGVFSYAATVSYTTAPGPQSMTYTVSDAQGRATHDFFNGLMITACTQLGACCTSGGCVVSSGPACAGQQGTFHGVGTNCGTASYTIGNNSAQFVDISGTGTLEPITSGCDDCVADVTLPFSFSFYGTSYNDVWISSNGNLQFGSSAAANYVNDTPPSAALPNNAIYPLWDDLYYTTGGIYYETDGAAPNRTFTVAWINRGQFARAGTSETFEAILHETSNNIEFRYGNLDPDSGGENGPGGSDYTVGVENGDGTVASVVPGAQLGSGNTALMVTFVPGVNPCTRHCGSADFNCDGAIATDADIDSFFLCLAGTCPPPPCTSTADFDGDGAVATDQDIEAFFRVLAGQPC
jgi:hypothetical protein